MKTKPTVIIDFDSTFVSREGLETLAEVALDGRPDRDGILGTIRRITDLGMEGKIPFRESLKKRVSIIQANKTHIDSLVRIFTESVTRSVTDNRDFFRKNADRIYVVSGGFREFIEPVTDTFGIPRTHILANTFVFDGAGNIIGADETNPLTNMQGKPNVLRTLELSSPVVMVGDGYTDAEVKLHGVADIFIAYVEHARRERAVAHADYVAETFDEVMRWIA